MATRRQLLAAGAIVGAGLSLAAQAKVPRVRPADVSQLAKQSLVNRERASAMMAREGLQAVVCTRAANVYYLTSQWPLTDRQQGASTAIAVIPRDVKAPVAFIVSQFSYYYVLADDDLPPGVQAYLVTRPDRVDPHTSGMAAALPNMFRIGDEAGLTAREKTRRARTQSKAPFFASLTDALAKALKDLAITDTVGVDEDAARMAVAAAQPDLPVRPADDVLRWTRLMKTPTEVELMRLASQANIEAALIAAKAARQAGSIQALRARFFAEAAARGNTGVFMVIDGVSSDAYDAPFVEGQSLLIDCVSMRRGYHGDYGRTVFLGEPRKAIRQATTAMGTAWDEVRAMMRPGVRFSQVREAGQAALRKMGRDYWIAFQAHSVGLFHTDQPRAAGLDLVLEEGMILSVDCPLMEMGWGGTAHLEDLVRITASGAEPIHDTGNRVILV
jgi:Xaa-Pro aminopeptidase